jgi:hypothetical protein
MRVVVPSARQAQVRSKNEVARCYGYRTRDAKSGKMGDCGSRAIAGLSTGSVVNNN